MARVCPQCKRLTSDEELFCLQCGQQTVDPQTWKAMRKPLENAREKKPVDEKKSLKEIGETRVKIGLGGMLAFFTFFLVYLAVYLTYVLTRGG